MGHSSNAQFTIKFGNNLQQIEFMDTTLLNNENTS